MYDELLKRAEIKSGMLLMGEKIAFGSDAAIIDELVAAIRDLTAKLDAVKPRPIEEAPKDGRGILAIYDKFDSLDRFDLRRWQRREWATKLPIGWADKYGQLRLVQPTHFIPLSALTALATQEQKP